METVRAGAICYFSFLFVSNCFCFVFLQASPRSFEYFSGQAMLEQAGREQTGG